MSGRGGPQRRWNTSRGGDHARGNAYRGRADTTRARAQQRPPSDRGRGGDNPRGSASRGRGDGGPPGSQPGRFSRGGGGGGGRGGDPPPTEPKTFQYAGQDAPLPDKEVTDYENDVVSSLDLSRLSLGTPKPNPMRPGYGSCGQKTVLWTNSFTLNFKHDLPIHKYVVTINPLAVGRKAKRLVQLFIEEKLNPIRDEHATDYVKTLVALRQIPEHARSARIKHRMEDEEDASPRAPEHVVTLTLERTVTFQQLLNHVQTQERSLNLTDMQYLIQILNIIMAHTMKFKSLGPLPKSISLSNRHYPLIPPWAEFQDLGEGLMAARGIAMSVRPGANRVYLNNQPKHVALCKPGALEMVMFDYVRVGDAQTLRQRVQSRDPKIRGLHSFLNTKRIDATHLTAKRNRRIPTVKVMCGLATPEDGTNEFRKPTMDRCPRVPFLGASAYEVEFFYQPRQGAATENLQANTYVSVAKFFDKVHNIQVAKDLPVVNVGKNTNPLYLPADVCKVLRGQPAGQFLSPDQQTKMKRFAVRRPALNAKTVANDSKEALGLTDSKLLRNFTADIGAQMIAVPGRILTGPQPLYGNNMLASADFGSWNLVKTKNPNVKDVQLLVPASLKDWGVVSVTYKGESDGNWRPVAQGIVQAFTQKLRDMGMSVDDPTVTFGQCNITVNRRSSRKEQMAAISRLFDDAKKRFGQTLPKFFLVIIPRKDGWVHSAIKICSEIRGGFQSQVVDATKFIKLDKKLTQCCDLQTLANIGLKVNLKMGGSNHTLEDSKMGVLRGGKFMLMGLDVTHPSPGSREDAPSVVGIVASVDFNFSRYPGSLHAQKGGKEMAEALTDLVRGRLLAWKAHNNENLPENILIFRDGVSEGQHSHVLDQELPKIQKAINQTYPQDWQPRITLIISVKRHNRRFYPTDETQTDKSSNPLNGTIVDRVITQPQLWDFYLQAHAAIQGTAIPAHYYVLYDEIFTMNKDLKDRSDVLEDLVHNLCYMYGRATKAVSLAPPAYFADLLCERARKYLSELFEPDATGADDASVATSSTDHQSRITPHPNIQNTMFYI